MATLVLLLLIYSSSNLSNLDDLTQYMDEYNAGDSKYFNDLNLALKIMPGYNTEKNALYMTQTNDVRNYNIYAQ